MEAKIFLTIHKVHTYGYAHASFPLLCLTLQLFNQHAKSMECLLSTPLTSMKTTGRNSKAFGIWNSFPPFSKPAYLINPLHYLKTVLVL